MQLNINFTFTLTVLQIAFGQFFENFENTRAINPLLPLDPCIFIKSGSSSIRKGQNSGELISHELAPIYEDLSNVCTCIMVQKPR